MNRPGTILRAKDRDLYCEWSSVVDAPVYIGDRAALTAWLLDYYSPHERRSLGDGGAEAEVEALLSQVDQRGTSSKGRHGAWDDAPRDRGLIYLDAYWLERPRLGELLDAYLDSMIGSEWSDPDPAPLVEAGVLDPIEDPS